VLIGHKSPRVAGQQKSYERASGGRAAPAPKNAAQGGEDHKHKGGAAGAFSR